MINQLAMVRNELDAFPSLVALSVRKMCEVIGDTADDAGDTIPIPRSLKHPVKERVGDCEGVLRRLLQERVCNLLARKQAIWTDENTAILVEHGRCQHDLLRLVGIPLHETSGIHGNAC